ADDLDLHPFGGCPVRACDRRSGKRTPMKLPRRQFLHLAAGGAALLAVSRIAWAQAYPSRPVRIIVNLAPGGGLDFNSRLIGEFVSRSLGQQVIVENKPGAGGMSHSRTSERPIRV